MSQQELNCACGKKFSRFCYYKTHLGKYKCHIKTNQSELDTNIETPFIKSQNTPADFTKITTLDGESTELAIEEPQPGKIAYKTSTPNTNPKTLCNYCDKLYSKHHIKSHKLKCKHKYKDCYEYKLLVRAGIPDIPESYFEVQQLFYRLNEERPQIFNNLPPDRTQYDNIESGFQPIGRPKK